MNSFEVKKKYSKIKSDYYLPLVLITLTPLLGKYYYVTFIFLIILGFSLSKTIKLDSILEKLISVDKNIIQGNVNCSYDILYLLSFVKKGVFSNMSNQLYFYSKYLKIMMFILEKKFKKANFELISYLEEIQNLSYGYYLPQFRISEINQKKILFYIISESRDKNSKDVKNLILSLINTGCRLEIDELYKLNVSESDMKFYLDFFKKVNNHKKEFSSSDLFRLLNK